MCFWCSVKYTHAMDLNFGYVAPYGTSRFVTKVGMSLMCRFFSYELRKLYARSSLMLFISPLLNFSLSTSTP
jgi:hypothetical protein